MAIEPVTVGEQLMQLDGSVQLLNSKFDTVMGSLNRIVVQFEKLETTKIADQDRRIKYLEDKETERKGMIIFMKAIVFVLGVAVTVLTLKAYWK